MKCLLCMGVCVRACMHVLERDGGGQGQVNKMGVDIHQAMFYHNALHFGGRMSPSVGLEHTS